MKHTPGPWRVGNGRTNSGVFTIDCHIGIAQTHGYQDNSKDSGELKDEQDANARLIAAAPDLLEALIDLVEYEGSCSNPLEDAHVMERACDAIAKATGEEE